MCCFQNSKQQSLLICLPRPWLMGYLQHGITTHKEGLSVATMPQERSPALILSCADSLALSQGRISMTNRLSALLTNCLKCLPSLTWRQYLLTLANTLVRKILFSLFTRPSLLSMIPSYESCAASTIPRSMSYHTSCVQ